MCFLHIFFTEASSESKYIGARWSVQWRWPCNHDNIWRCYVEIRIHSYLSCNAHFGYKICLSRKWWEVQYFHTTPKYHTEHHLVFHHIIRAHLLPKEGCRVYPVCFLFFTVDSVVTGAEVLVYVCSSAAVYKVEGCLQVGKLVFHCVHQLSCCFSILLTPLNVLNFTLTIFFISFRILDMFSQRWKGTMPCVDHHGHIVPLTEKDLRKVQSESRTVPQCFIQVYSTF